MILEVFDPRVGGVRTRLRLETLPLTVGRGYGNDLILDDPYVDARHARIALDDDTGALVVEDLGSLNGLALPGDGSRAARVVAGPGAEVRLGRTVLRFRHPDDAVPPALPDNPVAPEPASAPVPWISSLWVRLGVPAAALAAVCAQSWLGNFERSASGDVFSGALAFAALVSVWAGIWAVAGRVVVHRFHFLGHLAVASAGVLAGLAATLAEAWSSFLSPDNPITGSLSVVVWVALTTALVAGHLSLASSLPDRRRWRAGLVTAAVLVAVSGAMVVASDEPFSDVPEFAGVLKPVPAAWIPTGAPEDLGRMAAELKEEVDALAEEE
ncbi:MAG TPA: FHA domain-containing protein [Longimicrobiaceae bacterium]|nr:FHA domain-containing protein [Longimicrobiaceae bacterium]